MGALISRLRAKPSTKDLLEDLEKEIESLEEYKRSTDQQHKRVVGSLIFYFILLFIIGAGIFVLYYFPVLATTKEKLIYSIPLWLVPLLFYFLKKFLHWYFMQKIKYNEESLIKLRKRRRSLLDFAMETETYKVVKDLLLKYDPDYHKRVFEAIPAIEAPPAAPVKGTFGEFEVKRRSPSKVSSANVVTPGPMISLNNTSGPTQVFPPFPGKSPTNPHFLPPYLQRPSHQHFVRSPVQPMPRPVLPRERTLIDRIVDYLVGDGPSNRYALICRQCQSHNGMAMKEEFEYIAFRCCYCFHWNPPRNQQPPPMRLPLPAPSTASPTVTEPSEASLSSGAEDNECESLHDDDEVVRDGDVSHHSSSGSPKGTSLRKRHNISVESEVNAVLEEDSRTKHIQDYSNIEYIKEE